MIIISNKVIIERPIFLSLVLMVISVAIAILSLLIFFNIIPLYVKRIWQEYFIIASLAIVTVIFFWAFLKDRRRNLHFYPDRLVIKEGLREEEVYLLKNIEKIEPVYLSRKYLGYFDYRLKLKDGGKSEDFFLKKKHIQELKNLNQEWDDKIVYSEKYMA